MLNERIERALALLGVYGKYEEAGNKTLDVDRRRGPVPRDGGGGEAELGGDGEGPGRHR